MRPIRSKDPKRARTVRRSTELFLKAFELCPIAMTIRQGPEGRERLIRANQAYFELTGYTAEEAIGRLPGEIDLWVDRGPLVRQLARGIY